MAISQYQSQFLSLTLRRVQFWLRLQLPCTPWALMRIRLVDFNFFFSFFFFQHFLCFMCKEYVDGEYLNILINPKMVSCKWEPLPNFTSLPQRKFMILICETFDQHCTPLWPQANFVPLTTELQFVTKIFRNLIEDNSIYSDCKIKISPGYRFSYWKENKWSWHMFME